MAMQSSFKNMVICLTAICVVCSALMAAVYAVTKEPVEQANAQKTANALAAVLPEFEGEPVQSVATVDGKDYVYYTVSNGSGPVGYAIESRSSGFGGALKVMVGITTDGVIYNTSVLSHSETPGLGAKCTEEAFSAQFKNFDPSVKKLSVTKDGGDVDAITASTITSRAYCVALNNAVAVYNSISGAGIDLVSGASSAAEAVEEVINEGGQDNE